MQVQATRVPRHETTTWPVNDSCEVDYDEVGRPHRSDFLVIFLFGLVYRFEILQMVILYISVQCSVLFHCVRLVLDTTPQLPDVAIQNTSESPSVSNWRSDGDLRASGNFLCPTEGCCFDPKP